MNIAFLSRTFVISMVYDHVFMINLYSVFSNNVLMTFGDVYQNQ